jgi:hypothetical protein
MPLQPANEFRIRHGRYASDDSYDSNGYFLIPFKSEYLLCLISDSGGWDHVNISLPHRTPNWDEIEHVRDMFFDAADTVVIFSPPRLFPFTSNPYHIHLWRKQGHRFELPNLYFQ